jgi:opacity protein-like surface antigen
MKKIILIIAVLFVVNSLIAQSKEAILINSGLSVPSSTQYFSDYWNAGFNFGGGFEYYLNSNTALQVYIDYNHFPFDDQKAIAALDLSSSTISSGGGANILNISVDVKYLLTNDKTFSPYILGGIGYFNFSLSDLSSSDLYGDSHSATGGSVSAFSINFGFGAEFMVSSDISIFADARYVLGFTNNSTVNFTLDQNVQPYTLSDNTHYIPLRVGVSYNL